MQFQFPARALCASSEGKNSHHLQVVPVGRSAVDTCRFFFQPAKPVRMPCGSSARGNIQGKQSSHAKSTTKAARAPPINLPFLCRPTKCHHHIPGSSAATPRPRFLFSTHCTQAPLRLWPLQANQNTVTIAPGSTANSLRKVTVRGNFLLMGGYQNPGAQSAGVYFINVPPRLANFRVIWQVRRLCVFWVPSPAPSVCV